MCAREPLRGSALLPAIKLESEKIGRETALNQSDLNEKVVEAICRHLVVRDALGYWKFPHASVSEYFEAKNEPWVKQAKTELAVFLIDCLIDCMINCRLTHDEARTLKRWSRRSINVIELRNTLLPGHPLQCYIRTKLWDYIEDISSKDAGASDVTRALKRFLGEHGPHQSSEVYRTFCLISLRHHADPIFGNIMPSSNPILGVVTFGLHHLLDGWWDKGIDLVSMVNVRGSDLLTIATTHGRTAMCKDLLDRKEWQYGINEHVNLIHQRALLQSIISGKLDIFRLLLAKGVNPNGVIKGQSILCKAVKRGKDYYSPLLENGADPNIKCDIKDYSRGCFHGSALLRAAETGNFDAMAALISKGAEINSESLCSKGCYENPLVAAVRGPKGNFECVRLLVEKGANVNAHLRYDVFGSPLTAAVFNRRSIQPDCAAFLVEHGADVNYHPKFGRFGSPLVAAVVQGDIDGARYLIDHGADVNAYLEFGEYGCALAAAILGNENLDMVKFLIEEQKADLSRLAFVRPRRRWTKNYHEPSGGQDFDRDQRFARKPDGMCFTKYWITEYAWPISSYLVREHHIEVQTLFSMGVPMDYIPPDLMSGG